ncbi:MAG: hypothetical protein QOF62_807 [Pyrinomonadaceae bacterium]|jgi:hypothetical protein|nr:hypothetical protein [Pyrinomonadaceae bacterium]
MKRCPTCNQIFEDEWLTFCTVDGSPLIDTGALYQPPTVVVPPPVVTQQDMGQQSSAEVAPADYRPPPQSVPSTWQPPPPPRTVAGPSQSLAVWSMVLGLVSMTLGWCCSFGLLTAPVAIVLGIVALSQIKSQPNRYTGKPLAITGIVSGGLYFVVLAVIILIYGLGILLSGLHRL